MKLFRMGDRVITALGRKATVLSSRHDGVTIAYDDAPPSHGATFTEEAAARVLKFSDVDELVKKPLVFWKV